MCKGQQTNPVHRLHRILCTHCTMECRRGGRSEVTMRRTGCVRAVSKAEITEHGRWRTHNRGYEAMSENYNESNLEDHIYITLLCM
jgi:hypothetical protein